MKQKNNSSKIELDLHFFARKFKIKSHKHCKMVHSACGCQYNLLYKNGTVKNQKRIVAKM
jgi:hypothetical protein